MRPIAGTPSSRSATSGVATLYGRLATSTHGSEPSNDAQSRRRASPSTTVTPAGSTTLRSAGTSPESTSMAVTDAPVSARAKVSEPRPAPISTTRSPAPTPARRAMRRTVLGSTTKFWPRARLGARP